MSATALPKAANALRDLGRFQDIPVVRQLGVFVLAAAAIALGLWLFFWTQKPDYVTVQAGLDAKSTAEASDALRTAQIPFKLDNATGALTVPADQAGAARMTMASAGITASNPAGYESLQGDQGFGTSQFVENARYQHAMEIELARTITQLRPVREARVHLAMPKPSAFTRQNEPASASVVLQLNAGQSLEQNQIDAIERLVASSVSDLSPERVTVVDQFGRLLSQDDPTSDEAVSNKQFEQQRRQEAMYVQRIEELLAPMTGPGRVSAKVSVDMDFAQTEQASETYGPQPAIVRSEQLSESGNLSASNANAQGVPGSASNTPNANTAPAAPANGAAPAANATAANTSSGGQGTRSSVRNYEIDRTLTHTRQATPRIRRVTAAVLVDNVPGVPAAAGKPAATRALNDAELKRIETLVQQAIGFDQQRGDVVSVVNAPFAPATVDAPDTAIPLWQDPRNLNIARLALGGLAVLGLIIFVLRPAFKSMLSPRGANGTAMVMAGAGAGGPQVMPTVTAEMVDDDEVPVKLSPAYSPKPALPPAPGFDQKLQSARDVASADPKRVAQVVREMVASDG
ncbi:flagellar M-ring protein FliF [Pseudoxanthomonas sp. GM95]|uniref:flagellar basal-body MS-ring/collar protein FliF n=1 Tax=Pseudoxanthomonas sp. GM95 TaxID=1881043 RepID=UPI0008C10597|nr:flagellar basal-body MS-ring/collar protein FliF [Pseudoxanthomonas sp. GM95]SEK50710.1 flagellar M-ring protein FliF [Pseudoxanthomonas sp. GM95]